MKAFIIVHLPSGNWFPQTNKAGSSFIDIHDKPFKSCMPRLWETRGRAEGWLKRYCRGGVVPYKTTENDGPLTKSYTVISGISYDEALKRPYAEFKVYQVNLEMQL